MKSGEVQSNYTDSEDIWNIVGYVPKFEWLRTARDVVAGQMLAAENQEWTASRQFALDETPTLKEILEVPSYDWLFQDPSVDNYYAYFSHSIGKRSLIPPRPR